MERIKSGVEGIDSLLFGGLPSGRAYLVSGEPGAGKTIFTLQFLLEGLNAGENAVYISIDEKPGHVIDDARSLGWELAPFLESGALQVLDLTTYFTKAKLDQDGGINSRQIIDDVVAFVKKAKAKRLAVDPISPLVFAERELPEISEYIKRLIFSIEDLGCTTLLTSYVPVGSKKVSQNGIEEFAASGIIRLRMSKTKNKYIRAASVRKMRGSRIDLTEYSYDILPNRGIVLRQPL